MAITFQNLGASANPDFNDNADLSSYANTSWTPPTSGLIVLFVLSRATSGTANIPTVSGNSLTWVQIATALDPSSTWRITLFGANASGSTTGATTIAFGGQTQFMCRASFFHADGVDLTGGVAAAFVQAPTVNGTNVQSLNVTLASPGNAANRPIAAFAHGANEGKTPRTNWTEVDDLFGSFVNSGIETQWRSDAFETTASATWSTPVNAVGIAAELKGGATGPNINQDAYRWRNDDGNESTATWRQAEDTKGVVSINQNTRLRIQLNATTGDPASAQYRLEFSKHGGAWTAVGPGQSVVLSNSTHIAASGEATTAQLTAPAGKTTGDFVAGRIQDDENPADAIDITTEDYTELEFCIQFTEGGKYTLRLTDNGTPLGGYTQTPLVYVISGAPAALRAYWKLEEGSAATTFVDQIAGHDATLTVGDVSQVTGKVGNALHHEGTAAARLAIADHADFEFLLAEGYSIALWFRTTTLSNTNYMPFFAVVQAANDQGVYAIGYWDWAGTDQNIVVSGHHDDSGDGFQLWSSPNGVLGDDQWHFAVYTFTPVIALLYIDGQVSFLEANAVPHDFTGDITGEGNALHISILSRRAVSPETLAFDGDLDEIGLFEGVLTPEQIQAMYNAGAGLDYLNVLGTLTQDAYRWRNDDGSESAATWRQAEDTADTVPPDTNVRLRIQVDAAGNPDPAQFLLEYRKRVPLQDVPDAFGDWTDQGVVLPVGADGAWDEFLWMGAAGTALYHNGTYYLYYLGAEDDGAGNGIYRAIGLATSVDGLNFTRHPSNPIVTYTTTGFVETEEGASNSVVVIENGVWHMWYAASRYNGTPGQVDVDIRYRTSTDGVVWTNDTLIYQVAGDEYTPVGAFYYGGTWNVYILGPLTAGLGSLRRLSGSAPDNLPNQDLVLTGSFRAARGQALIGFNTYAIQMTGSDDQGRVLTYAIDRTDPGTIGTLLANYLLTGFHARSIFLDENANEWKMFALSTTAPNPIHLLTAPLSSSTFEYEDWLPAGVL